MTHTIVFFIMSQYVISRHGGTGNGDTGSEDTGNGNGGKQAGPKKRVTDNINNKHDNSDQKRTAPAASKSDAYSVWEVIPGMSSGKIIQENHI